MVSICLLLIGVTLTPIYVMQLILKLFRYTSLCISWVLEKIILSLNLITEYYGTLIVSLRNKKLLLFRNLGAVSLNGRETYLKQGVMVGKLFCLYIHINRLR